MNAKRCVALQAIGLAHLDTASHLCLHPKYGPWFSLRAVLVFDGVAFQGELPRFCKSSCGWQLAGAPLAPQVWFILRAVLVCDGVGVQAEQPPGLLQWSTSGADSRQSCWCCIAGLFHPGLSGQEGDLRQTLGSRGLH